MAIIVGHLVGQDPRRGRTGRELTPVGGQKQAQGGKELVGKGELRQGIPSAHQEEKTCAEDANILPSRDDSKPVLTGHVWEASCWMAAREKGQGLRSCGAWP